jgi:uncharacterized protein YprB with RNaseH-like and TPR domain
VHIPGKDERAMLLNLRQWLDHSTAPETMLCGHNIRGFDKPKLRARYVHHRLKLPQILQPGQQTETLDTATLYKAFSIEHRQDFMVSLETVCQGLGIDLPKQVITGADVPNLHQKGEYQTILTYNCVDTIATERAYLLMTSNAHDME